MAAAPPQSTSGQSTSGKMSLADQISADLLERLQSGELRAGERLPTEHQLTDEYGVSRATVRSALRRLESLGLTVTRHGLGTFANAGTTEVRADLRQLNSLSDTIASFGLTSEMSYRSRAIRAATAEERRRLELPARAKVLATERELTADGTVVAFSYDAIPRLVFPEHLDIHTVDGSLFAVLEAHKARVATALTEVHAASGNEVGWGPRPAASNYVLLSQVHYLENARPVMYSNTFFVEGRFTFSLIRTR
ncbi:MAG: GntR family transcriptional regulator [Acidimicrobiia bacterium]